MHVGPSESATAAAVLLQPSPLSGTWDVPVLSCSLPPRVVSRCGHNQPWVWKFEFCALRFAEAAAPGLPHFRRRKEPAMPTPA